MVSVHYCLQFVTLAPGEALFECVRDVPQLPATRLPGWGPKAAEHLQEKVVCH